MSAQLGCHRMALLHCFLLLFTSLHAGLLAILTKSIAIAIAILGGKSIVILIVIFFSKSLLQYFLQYPTICFLK